MASLQRWVSLLNVLTVAVFWEQAWLFRWVGGPIVLFDILFESLVKLLYVLLILQPQHLILSLKRLSQKPDVWFFFLQFILKLLDVKLFFLELLLHIDQF